ncbi:MAG TPA: class I adenylate-forming enzyme family protein [bacterium]|nr:class I adenylate-forming enzyme family protein [bacterium]
MPVVSPILQLQAGLQTLRSDLATVRPVMEVWADVQDLVQQAQSSALTRPMLPENLLPHVVGYPSQTEIDATIGRLERSFALGPIRRNDFIARNVSLWGGRVAVRQGKKRTNYRTLDHRADVVGMFLAMCIRDSGQRAAVFFSYNRNNLFEITLGCRRAGVGFTSIPSYLSAEQFLEKLEEEKAKGNRYKVLFFDSQSLSKVEPLLPLLESQGYAMVDIDSQHPSVLSYGSLIADIPKPRAQTPDAKPPPYPGPIMYSSGTTGNPKLISVKAAANVGAKANKVFGIRQDDKNLVIGQLYHGGAYSWARGHLNRGGEVVVTEHSSLTLNPKAVLSDIEARGITNFWVSPPWLQGLCDYLEKEPQEQGALSSLRAIYVGASHFHPALKRLAVERFGEIVWENYATTELGLIALLRPEELSLRPATVGRAAPETEIEIRDDQGEAVPLGTPGTIWVRNERTGGEFREGDDFGRLDADGYLTVLGRTVERIVFGKQTIYPREIENELMEMPGIQECHVIGIPSPSPSSNPEPTVVVAVVLKKKVRLTEREIRDYLSARDGLSHISGVPLTVVFVPSLPRKPYKVNYPILRDMVIQRIQGHTAR